VSPLGNGTGVANARRDQASPSETAGTGWAFLRPVGILLAARLTMFAVFAMAKDLDHQIGRGRSGTAAGISTQHSLDGLTRYPPWTATPLRALWRSFLCSRFGDKVAGIILAPAGIVAWFAYLWATTGSRLAWLHTEQQGWGEQIQPLAFLHLVAADRHHPFPFANEYVPIISTLAVAIMVLTAIPLVVTVSTLVLTGACEVRGGGSRRGRSNGSGSDHPVG